MGLQRTTLVFIAFLLFAAQSSHAQSKKQLKAYFEYAELYIGVKTYDASNIEKRVKKIFIDTNTGSYAHIVIKNIYLFRLPAGDYRYKTYRRQGNKFLLHGTYQSTFESANELRAQVLFEKTGDYRIEAYKGKDFKIGEVALEVNAKKQ